MNDIKVSVNKLNILNTEIEPDLIEDDSYNKITIDLDELSDTDINLTHLLSTKTNSDVLELNKSDELFDLKNDFIGGSVEPESIEKESVDNSLNIPNDILLETPLDNNLEVLLENTQNNYDEYDINYNMIGGSNENLIEFEYDDNIMDNYNLFLKSYKKFYDEQKKKSNLSKYIYIDKNEKLIKKNRQNNKIILTVIKPNIINIYEILKQITEQIDTKLFELKLIRNEIIKKRTEPKINEFKNIKKKYIELLDYKNNILEYYNKVNKLNEKEISLRNLINNKIEIKTTLTKLSNQIKLKNEQKESVKELCLEYIKQNTINNLEKQIREIEYNPPINYIVTNIKKEYTEESVPNIIKETKDLKDSILNIEELNIDEDNLEKLDQSEDPEEINYYENKPELNDIDAQIPIEFSDSVKINNLENQKLKKALLKPAKKSKKKKLIISKGKNKIDKDTPITISKIKASQISDGNVKRRKLNGLPITDGMCVFPFKNKDTYITEEDGCIQEKHGKMCATSVDDDYKPKTLGFCE